MKADEYAEVFYSYADEKEGFAEVGLRFIRETGELVKNRKIASASGLNGVLREQRQKWIAFCRKTGDVLREDGFEIMMKQFFPEIAKYL